MKNHIYIVFGDTPRSDGNNVQGIFLSKEKAEKYKSVLEDMSTDGNYHIEHFTIDE